MSFAYPIIKYEDERTGKVYCLSLHDDSEETKNRSLKELKARADYEYIESLPPRQRAELKMVQADFTCPFCKKDTEITSRKITKTSGFLFFVSTTIHDIFKCEDCEKEFEEHQLNLEINRAMEHNFQVENFEFYKDLKLKNKTAPENIMMDSYNPYQIYIK